MACGLVLLLLALPAGAASVTLAWDASTTLAVTEYIVHYGTSPGVYTAHESAGLSLTKTLPNLIDGERYYFAVTAKVADGESIFSNEVNYRQSFSNPPVQILLQAEAAILEHPFIAIDDIGAMGGRYAASTNTDVGVCKFVFPVPFMDEFVVWARILSPTEAQDSFYVAHNSKPADIFDTVKDRAPVWQWARINGRGGVGKPLDAAHAIDPRLFVMSGTNDIKFMGRETWTGLDAVLITNDRNLVPRAPPAPFNLQLTLEQ